MAKRRKNLIDDVLDRASDVGRDSRELTRRALTGKKKRKKRKNKNLRTLVKRNNRALEALVVQLDRYVTQERRTAEKSGSAG
ncbi:hypothetical protein [Streptomyces sp. bgisy022]|uniref:hypothetical protein n=1 Tax=Streptomyces sp. bgisy022 TaxID=3413769 RepID=UPI003D729A9F